MQPSEPTAGTRFNSAARLFEHVVKHVFGMGADQQEDEGWKKILKAPGFCDAVSAVRKGQYALPAVQSVAQAYEAHASATLLAACQEGRDHRHFLVKGVAWEGAQLKLEERFEEIILCDRKQGLFLVAACVVSPGGDAPYFLRTAYRPHPALRGDGFLRKAQEKMKRKNRENESSQMLADHTQW